MKNHAPRGLVSDCGYLSIAAKSLAIFSNSWWHPRLTDWCLPWTLVDRQTPNQGHVIAALTLVLTREGERNPIAASQRSHYVNKLGLPPALGASAPLMVPCVPILFCPRQWSWVMGQAEPANAWCNCQRDLIISTLHVGLRCKAVCSSLWQFRISMHQRRWILLPKSH